MFEEFLLFFLPDLYEKIDFSKPPDFLQQELFKEIIKVKKCRKIADQIIKVHLKDGQEKWILIHIEVQGDADTEFPKRMFQYFYRIYDRYDREIVAMAIQTGASKREIPDAFEYSYFGTELRYAYNQYMVMEQNESELEHSPNLFSKAILAAIYANKTMDNADARFAFKLKLMRSLLRVKDAQNLSVSSLIYFVDYLLLLPEELKEPLRAEFREEDFKMLHFDKNNLPPTVGELMARDREEGIKKAVFEERRTLARNMIKQGRSNKEIAEIIPLSLEEIESLRLS
jgi:predicted transposase/invertase (TIGR01784 family)